MKRALAFLTVSACLVSAGCRPAHNPAPVAGSQQGRANSPRAGCDTTFTSRYLSAPSDSGFDLVQVDAAGDSLSLYLQWIEGPNPHLRIWGPTLGRSRHTERRLLRFHRLELQDRHEIFESAADVNAQGANSEITDLKLEPPAETAEGVDWRQTWQYVKRTGSRDTLVVARTVRMRCGEEYFVVRYDFTWLGARARTVRFIWSNHPRTGAGGSKHDVGFVPGYGLVTRQHVFAAADAGYFAGVADIGNPRAPGVDVTTAGSSSYLSPELLVDPGSGKLAFAAGFVCFNPAQSIVPSEIAWMDSTGEGIPSLDYDSPHIALDTTRVLDGGFRTLLARTDVISFVQGETKTLEYAVGRATLAERSLPVIFPEVVWFDGATSRPPRTPRR